MELNKYFLFGFYKKDLNRVNPLGLGGKLATAYANLMRDMWLAQGANESFSRGIAPYDLKKTLGKRVQRFSGYGQQDSAELVSFLIDLLHEDTNRVLQKPFKELSEEEGRSDETVAAEYWDAYTARNKSIIVDIMTGQLKSTVTCVDCGWVSVSFDPMQSIQVPIPKAVTVDVTYVH